jgi:hypothetical protein
MNYKNQGFIINEVRNIFSKVCLSCVLIVIAIVSVVSLAVIVWTQII